MLQSTLRHTAIKLRTKSGTSSRAPMGRTPSTRRDPSSTHCAVMYLSNVPVPFFLLERIRSMPGFLSHQGIRCISIAIAIPSFATCPSSRIASSCTRTELAKSFIISALSVLERIPLNHSSLGVAL